MELNIEDPAALRIYLHERDHLSPNESIKIIPLTGGVSNRTVFVKREGGEDWVIKQALEKLRVAVDWFSHPERIHREAAGLRAMAELLPTGTVPEIRLEDHDFHLLAMTAVPQPHENWKQQLLSGIINPAHIRQFGQILATIHRKSMEQAATMAPNFTERRFFETLRLEPYYIYAASQVPAAAPFLHALVAQTRRRHFCLVHGDYSPKNVLVHREQLVLLDFEVIHWGDPAFDLGFSLTHLLSKAHHLPAQRNEFVNAAMTYWQTYQQILGATPWTADLESWGVQHTLACLLARVAGRSPLEYFTIQERARQKQVVTALLPNVPAQIDDLIEQFIDGVILSERADP